MTGEADTHPEQRRIEAYFDEQAGYWDSVYRESDLQGVIYQQREAFVLSLVDSAALAGRAPALEIGCGAGRLTVELARRGLDVRAIDSSEAMVRSAAERVEQAGLRDHAQVSMADAHELPFAAGTFRLVVAVGVMPWLHSPEAAIGEMARVLAPGGHLILTADNRWRLASLIDPRALLALSPLKSVYLTLRRRPAPSGSALHSPRQVDRMLEGHGLVPARRGSVGFGPMSFLGRPVLEGPRGLRLNLRLQRLADRGIPGLRLTGWHYVVAAVRQPERRRGAAGAPPPAPAAPAQSATGARRDAAT